MIVGGVDCLLQVRAKNVWTGRHEVVELTVREGVPSLTVTASHRVVKSVGRKANTVQAGELVAGDEVMIGDVIDASRAGKDLPLQDLLHKNVLKDSRKYFTDVGVIQLQFNLDKHFELSFVSERRDKQLGVKWNLTLKTWYIPARLPLASLSKLLPCGSTCGHIWSSMRLLILDSSIDLPTSTLKTE